MRASLFSLLLVPVFAHAATTGAQSVSAASQRPDNVSVVCDRRLTSAQREFCENEPEAFAAFKQGRRELLQLCQSDRAGSAGFLFEAWNCTTTIAGKRDNNATKVNIVPQGSREAAFLTALRAAGFLLGYARACEAGAISGCDCNAAREKLILEAAEAEKNQLALDGEEDVSAVLIEPPSDEAHWRWAGCASVIGQAAAKTEQFLITPSPTADSPALKGKIVVTHNENAAIHAVLTLAKATRRCVCHGLSALCQLKTCWDHIPSNVETLAHLKRLYQEARRSLIVSRKFGQPAAIAAAKAGSLRLSATQLTAVAWSDRTPLQRSELAFTGKRVNYCKLISPEDHDTLAVVWAAGKHKEHNVPKEAEFWPTKERVNRTEGRRFAGRVVPIWVDETRPAGRLCAVSDPRSGQEEDHCDAICCGRGTVASTLTETKRCGCRFEGCCELRCDQCYRITTLSYCT